MAERSYLVGLPVAITVDDDGKVTYEIDTSEAGPAITDLYYESEDHGGVPDWQWDDDATAVRRDHDLRVRAAEREREGR